MKTDKIFQGLLVAVLVCVSIVGGLSIYDDLTKEDIIEATSNDIKLPISHRLVELVQECEAKENFANQGFNSFWSYSIYADKAFFHCDIRENIDYRERSRLYHGTANPQQVDSWSKTIEM